MEASGIPAEADDDPSLAFEFGAGVLEITPGVAKVLLRIMRKAAERRGIDLDDTGRPQALTS